MMTKFLMVLSMLFAFTTNSHAELIIDNSPAPVYRAGENQRQPDYLDQVIAEEVKKRQLLVDAEKASSANAVKKPYRPRLVTDFLFESNKESTAGRLGDAMNGGVWKKPVERRTPTPPALAPAVAVESKNQTPSKTPPTLASPDTKIKIIQTTNQELDERTEVEISACMAVVAVIDDSESLQEDIKENLKRTWCIIAKDYYYEVKQILIATGPDYRGNAAVTKDGSLLNTQGNGHNFNGPLVVIGIDLIKYNSNDKYKDFLLFMLSHELAHYVNNDGGSKFKSGLAATIGVAGVGIGSFVTVFPGKLSRLKVGAATVAVGAGAFYLYCKSYYEWANNELVADEYAVKLLKFRTFLYKFDYKLASRSFIAMNNFKEKNYVMPKCTDIKDVKKISASKRNPHPSTNERNAKIEELLATY